MKILDIVHVHQLKKRQDLIWHQRVHKHEKNQYEFHYFIQGEGSLRIEKKNYQYQKHELFLVLPEIIHAVKSKNSHLNPISYYAILFELETQDTEVNSFLNDEYFLLQFPFKVSHRNHLIFETLLHQRMQEKNLFLHKSADYKLYSYLYEIFSTRFPIQRDINVLDKKNIHIEKAISYMNRAIYENVSIATISQHIGISPEYLVRLFKTHLSTTPLHYFNQLKIEESCALLTNTNMKIQDIAKKFKFSNAHNFTRVFTRITGISPTQYKHTYLSTSGLTHRLI